VAAPPAFLDECVDQPLANALLDRGFVLLTARDAGTLGSSDEAQLEQATTRRMVLLTHNRLDFMRLHTALAAQGRAHGGIVVLTQRLPLPPRVLRAAMMLDWISEKNYESQLYRWGDPQ
jgi:hypothetical protein